VGFGTGGLVGFGTGGLVGFGTGGLVGFGTGALVGFGTGAPGQLLQFTGQRSLMSCPSTVSFSHRLTFFLAQPHLFFLSLIFFFPSETVKLFLEFLHFGFFVFLVGCCTGGLVGFGTGGLVGFGTGGLVGFGTGGLVGLGAGALVGLLGLVGVDASFPGKHPK